MRKLLCRLLGHKYNPIDVLLASIKISAINKDELTIKLPCKRCKEKIVKEL